MDRKRRPKPTEKKEGAVAPDRGARVAAVRAEEAAKEKKREESRKKWQRASTALEKERAEQGKREAEHERRKRIEGK